MKKPSPPRRTRDEVKHQAILKAAAKLFLKHGYSSTSMDAIADAARVTKQTVYSHYQSKDILFTEMLTHLCDKHSASDNILRLGSKKLEEGMFAIGLSFLNMVTNPEVMAMTRLVIAEMTAHPKLAKRYYEDGTQRVVTMLSHYLDQYKIRGELSDIDTKSAASYFIAMLKGQYYLRMLLGVKPVPAAREKEQHVRETVSVFLKVYADPNPLSTSSTL
jgi:TetR/AcrR family transcriptional repressor of mexJK operon